MNFMGKSGGSMEEKDGNEPPPTVVGPLLLSSSSSYYHHHHNNQEPYNFSPPPYNVHHQGGWMAVDHGEPSPDQKEEGGWNIMVEREHMFDKAVTPSDVGKLNRLVIPKQHAEKYFPLDSSTNYKGLLLNFEDRNGKIWRFQYSYWNSSQSYVMTKGWSRFVKEKKLDAGDIVSFQRGVGATAKDRLFIDWRRRVNPTTPPHQLSASSDLSFLFQNHNFIHPSNPLVLQSFPARRNPNFMLQPPNRNPNCSSSRSIYFGQGGFGTTTPQQPLRLGFGFDQPPPAVSSAAPSVNGKASGKRRLRLFGVNMDCVFSGDEEDQDYDIHNHNPSEILTDTSHTMVAGSRAIINPSIPTSSSTIPYLQLRPNHGGEPEYRTESRVLSGSSGHDFNIIGPKSKACNMSLDLKM